MIKGISDAPSDASPVVDDLAVAAAILAAVVTTSPQQGVMPVVSSLSSEQRVQNAIDLWADIYQKMKSIHSNTTS